ncbi:hypothetical protein SBADM41S_08503 [Streptomyces badius]
MRLSLFSRRKEVTSWAAAVVVPWRAASRASSSARVELVTVASLSASRTSGAASAYSVLTLTSSLMSALRVGSWGLNFSRWRSSVVSVSPRLVTASLQRP